MKIKIRRAEPDDYRALHQIYTQPNAIRGTLQLPFPSVEMWRKRLIDRSDDFYNLVACVEDEVVGSLGLSVYSRSPRRRHVGTLGMGGHDRWQGQGIGTALMEAAVELADGWLNLIRLELTVFTDNDSAIKLYHKFGFKIEGALEKYAFREGRFVDTHSMARIKQPDVDVTPGSGA